MTPVALALTSLLALLITPAALATDSCRPNVLEKGGLTLTFKSGPISYNQLVTDHLKVSEAPTLKMNSNVTQHGKKLLVVMVDPDAPNLANCTYWLHWFFSGIFTQNGTLSNVTTAMPYAPPSPPAGTGIHHYQVLGYKMKDGATLPSISQRPNFALNNTVKDLVLGKAAASTQFRVQPH